MILIVGKFIHHYMTDRMLKRAGLTRNHFQFCSLEENPYDFKDIKVFIPLGNEGIKKMLGEQDIFRWVNRTIPLSDGRWILPNFCPSQLVPYKIAFDEDEIDEEGTRTPTRLQGMAASIFKRASILAAGGEKIEWPEKNYLCDPTPLEFEKWARAMPPTAPLSFDIETPYFKKDEQDEKDFTEVNNKKDESILRISFSYEPHNACSIPFQPHYYDIIRLLLASSNDKVVWNGRTFDIPRLKANGFNTVGTVYDGMDMFHWVQPDLDKGLEFVSSFYTSQQPWKHINNSEPAKYSCIDADVALLCYFGIRAQIEKSGGWNAFKVAAVDCMEVLEEAGQRGNFIDVAAQEDLRQRLNIERERLESEIQLVVPKERKPVTEYSRRPGYFDYETTVQGRIKVCDVCNQQISNKSAHHKGRGNPCRGGSVSNALGPVPRYVVIEPFNANSSKQLLEYAKSYNHPIGKNHKTGSDTIDVKVLQKLAGKYGKLHPLYSLTLELHKVSKALSTYVNGLAPDEFGKVHTTFVNTPSTFRLASRAVNMQNQGKRESNKWAKEARRTIVAPPGFKIVQADSSSIEAVITGYLMNDAHYIDIAKRSVHAYLCCKWKGWEPTDDNIRLIKKTEKELYEQLKRVVHGTAYGMGVRLMAMNDPEIFPTVKDAKKCQDFLFETFPNLKQWQNSIRQQAQKDCYLVSPFNHRHYFYDVFTYQTDNSGKIVYGNDGLPRVKNGKDSKRAIAYLPQHCAGMFARQNLVLLGTTRFREFMGANVSVHDSYALVVPDELVESAADTLVDILTRPIPELGGLRIGCAVEVGQNWGQMEEIRSVRV